MKATARKIITWLLYLLGIAPFSYIISILTFYFHARNILGRFPSYDNPDPGKLPIFRTYDRVIDRTFEIWAISFLVWIVLAIWLLIKTRETVSVRTIKVTSIGHVIAIFITLGPIFEWYID